MGGGKKGRVIMMVEVMDRGMDRPRGEMERWGVEGIEWGSGGMVCWWEMRRARREQKAPVDGPGWKDWFNSSCG